MVKVEVELSDFKFGAGHIQNCQKIFDFLR